MVKIREKQTEQLEKAASKGPQARWLEEDDAVF